MEPDTEACNVDNHGVHNDDDNGCGDGVNTEACIENYNVMLMMVGG